MKRSHRLLKITAIVSSFLLIGLYVYDRAGGHLLDRVYLAASTDGERYMMSSSKLKAPLIPVEGSFAKKSELLPGSKWIPVIPRPDWISELSEPNSVTPDSTVKPNPFDESDVPFSQGTPLLQPKANVASPENPARAP